MRKGQRYFGSRWNRNKKKRRGRKWWLRVRIMRWLAKRRRRRLLFIKRVRRGLVGKKWGRVRANEERSRKIPFWRRRDVVAVGGIELARSVVYVATKAWTVPGRRLGFLLGALKYSRRYRRNRRLSRSFVLRLRTIKYPRFLYRRSILWRFRHPFYMSFIRSNFFLCTPVSREKSLYIVSTGLLDEFRWAKKKKKTVEAGFVAWRLFRRPMIKYGVRGLRIYNRGRLPARRGVFKGMRSFFRRKGFLTGFYDRSRVVHNGTRGYSKRRL